MATTYSVKVVVTDEGTVKVARDLESVGKSAAKGQSGVDMLNKSLRSANQNANSFNVGNVASQFNDIGVTAAAGQKPLQIALQQGTQLAQVFGQQGLTGVLKTLGGAFLQVFSPVSLITIAVVGLVAAGIQLVDWAKVMAATFVPLISYMQSFLSYVQQSPALLAAAGAAFLVTFGPPALAAVTSLISAISVGLVGAITSVITLLIANPVTLVIASIAAAISYVITQTIGWKAAIETVIEVWGRVIKVVGILTDYFGLTKGLSDYGQSIINGAQTAAANIYANLKGGGDYIFSSLQKGLSAGKTWLSEGVDSGSASGAQKLKAGVEEGAAAGAKLLKEAQERAIRNYEDMNGKAVEQIGQTLVDGGKYFYNRATGELSKAGEAAGQKMKSSVTEGGNTAARTMQSSIETGGRGVANAISGEAGGLIEAIHRYTTNLGDVARVINALIDRVASEAYKNYGEGIKSRQEAMAIRDGRSGDSGRGRSSSGSGGGGGAGYSGGGGGAIPSYPSAISTGLMGYAGVAGSGGLSFDGGKATGTRVGGQKTEPSTTVQIQNVVDPNVIVKAMETAEGVTVVKNVITLNREEFQRILGVV